MSRGGEGFAFPLLLWVLRAEIRLCILHFVQLPGSIPTLIRPIFAHCLALLTTNLVGNLFIVLFMGFFSSERFHEPGQAYLLLLKVFLFAGRKSTTTKNIVPEQVF